MRMPSTHQLQRGVYLAAGAACTVIPTCASSGRLKMILVRVSASLRRLSSKTLALNIKKRSFTLVSGCALNTKDAGLKTLSVVSLVQLD